MHSQSPLLTYFLSVILEELTLIIKTYTCLFIQSSNLIDEHNDLGHLLICGKVIETNKKDTNFVHLHKVESCAIESRTSL